MSNKYFDGVVKSTGVTEEVDADLKAVVTSARDKVAEKMKNLRVADAITEVFNLFRRCNKYIDETAPWVLAKDEAAKDRLAEVLYNLVESITIGACLLKSFLPETADRILAQLNAGMREYDDLDKFGLYENGNKVTDKPEILLHVWMQKRSCQRSMRSVKHRKQSLRQSRRRLASCRRLQRNQAKQSISRQNRRSNMMIL